MTRQLYDRLRAEVAALRQRVALLATSAGGGGAPSSHAGSHQNGGSDELDVTGLTGLLATAQTPATHATTHQNGGSDEISVAGLSGLLADAQTPLTHASSHQNGGGDEISVAGLSGLLADGQTPLAHAASHEGGSDPVDVTALDGFPGGTTTFLRADGSFAVPPGGVGGGGGWALVDSWTHSSDIANKDFPNLSGYSEILVHIVSVTLSVSGVRRIVVSTDNGSTWLTTSGDYISGDGTGGMTNQANILTHVTNATAARSAQTTFIGFNSAVANKPYRRDTRDAAITGHIVTSTALNAIRVDGSAGGNLTGGSIYIWGRV